MKNKKLWLALTVAFLAGTILGGAGGHFTCRMMSHKRFKMDPQGHRSRVLERISSRIGLSQEQKASLKAQFDSTFAQRDLDRMKRIQEDMELTDKCVTSINPPLSADQNKIFQEMRQERLRFAEKFQHPPPPPAAP